MVYCRSLCPGLYPNRSNTSEPLKQETVIFTHHRASIGVQLFCREERWPQGIQRRSTFCILILVCVPTAACPPLPPPQLPHRSLLQMWLEEVVSLRVRRIRPARYVASSGTLKATEAEDSSTAGSAGAASAPSSSTCRNCKQQFQRDANADDACS